MDQPTRNEATAVVMAMFDAFNRHDLDAMAALYADDAHVASPDLDAPQRGPEAIRAIYARYFESAPDIQDEVTRVFADGAQVAVEFVTRGTMTDPGPDAPEAMRWQGVRPGRRRPCWRCGRAGSSAT